MRALLSAGLAAVALSLSVPAGALALPAPAGVQQGQAVQAAQQAAKKNASAPCQSEIPVIGAAISQICTVGEEAAEALGGAVGAVAKAAGEGVLGLLAKWMIDAASTITAFVAAQMRATTTPELHAAWFEAQFRAMADLGAALGLLVTLIALASAAVRRSPEALAATLAGIVRAGLGTALALALTVIALDVADQISSAVLASSTQSFWSTVSHAWSTSGFGGFGSSALAMVIATVEVLAALFVWLELIARDAAIYLAVLFMPVILAASIWPALGSWIGRLARLLLVVIVLKPVALIVLSFAGAAGAAGLSFSEGLSASVATILVATVIFCLAAFAPWALMYLLAADAESAHTAAGVRAAAGSALAGSSGRSLRTAGGLRNSGGRSISRAHNASATGSRFSAATANNGGNGGGGPSGPGGEGAGPDGGGPSQGPDGPAGPGAAGDDGTLAIGAETVGAGSVGAAAGVAAHSSSASELGTSHGGSDSQVDTSQAGAQAAHADADTAEQAPSARSPAGRPSVAQPARPVSSSGVPRHGPGGRTPVADAPPRRGSGGRQGATDPGVQRAGALPAEPSPGGPPQSAGQHEPPDTGDAGAQQMARSRAPRGAGRLRLLTADSPSSEHGDEHESER